MPATPTAESEALDFLKVALSEKLDAIIFELQALRLHLSTTATVAAEQRLVDTAATAAAAAQAERIAQATESAALASESTAVEARKKNPPTRAAL